MLRFTPTKNSYIGLFFTLSFLLPQYLAATCGFSVQGAIIQNADCGAANASADLVIVGGLAPFTYAWSNGATSQQNTGLAAGRYSVTVADANACIQTTFVEISNNGAPVISNPNPNSATCQNTNGSYFFNLSGAAPYTVTWAGAATGTQNIAGTSAVINNLRAGAYALTLTDANGCKRVSSFNIAEAGNISMITSIPQSPTCAGGANGTIRATATAGSLPFDFTINGTSSGATFSNNFDFANLSAGIYIIQIRDGNGCATVPTRVTLNEAGATTITATDFSFASATCPSGATGSVVEVSPSALPYEIYNRDNNTLVGNLPQNALTAGAYEIRLSNGGCISRLPFEVAEPTAWVASMQITNPTCTAGQADADLSISGGTGAYTYAWSNGVTTEDLTDVVPDFYSLSVTDARGCVFVVAPVSVLNCSDRDTVSVLTGVTTTFCVDTNDVAGSVFTVVNLCPTGANSGTVNTVSVNGCISYTAGAVEGIDSVCVQVCNAAGTSCDTTIVYVFVQSPTDTFRTILQTNQTTNLCPVLTALPNAPTSTTDLNCRPLRFGTINSINATTSCVNYTAGTTMGYDTVCVLSCDAQGFCDTAVLIFQIQSPSDTSTFNVRANTEGTFCPNISSFSNPIVTVTNLNCTTIDGGVINGINTANGCVRYQAGNLAGLDTVCLVVCDAQGFCDTTVVYFNVVPAPDTVRLNFLPGDAAVDTCPYNIQNRGTLAAVTNLGCDMSTVGTITVNSTTGCVNYVPAIPQPGSGTRSDTACVVLCDNTSPTAYCDTVIYIFNNIEPTCGGTVPDILSYQVQDCATQVQVCLPIPLDSVADYDVLINGATYTNGYTGCAFVTKIQYPVVLVPACAADFFVSWTVNGVIFGPTQVTGFAGVVNQLNTWDTRTVWSLSPNGSVINGTNFGNDSISYGNLSIRCVSGGNPTLLGATTQQQYADGSNIRLNGLGNYRLTVIDQFGCVDTSLIRVVCVQSSTVLDTVFLDSVRTNCNIDLSQVAQVQTIQNACTPNGNLSLQLNQTTRCLTFTGARVGADTTCVVVCDSFGICDTTYFIVQIRVPSPIAFMDTMLIPFATNTGSKSVCLNDTIPNTAFTINIITQPTLGTLVSNGCTQTFTRSTPQTCGRDSFQYEIQNAGGSSRAWVYLDIRCKPFSISEGLSPNGDGLNDRFVINSLQNYPNHELYIYNRWGSQVFRTKNYQNDWEGTFIGNPLPDGTYYYLIEMNDDLNQVFTGYFILLR